MGALKTVGIHKEDMGLQGSSLGLHWACFEKFACTRTVPFREGLIKLLTRTMLMVLWKHYCVD